MGKAIDRWVRATTPEKLHGMYMEAAEESAEKVMERIRQAATAAGPDWAEAIKKATVERQGENIRLEFPKESFDLEYGTAAVPPRPVVRTTIYKHKRQINDEFDALLRRRVFGRTG